MQYPIVINGKVLETSEKLEIKSPYNGEIVGVTFRPSENDIENAIKGANQGFEKTKKLSTYKRVEILEKIISGLKSKEEEVSKILSSESGKPIKYSRIEVNRSIFTFTTAMEEAKRIYGEFLPLDLMKSSYRRFGIVRRFPIGPILGISPFNFPLNLVAHKIAPAIASGNSIILKPASQTPLSALTLGYLILESDLPEGGVNIIPASSSQAEKIVKDERIKKVTFTGSAEVGWSLKEKIGKKKITLELGGNAAVIIHSDADIDYAVDRCVMGAFSYSGQICISVQRIFVHKPIFEEFLEKFINKTKNLKIGNPLDEETDIGPMISEKDAERVISWFEEAKKEGAKILLGGEKDKSIVLPTILTNTKPDMKVNCMELFGPGVTVEPYNNFEEAITLVNNSIYGLQAGIFTNNIKYIWDAYENIEVGGVIVGDVPTYRIDHMPYGGIKDSGFGREGIRYAIEEMTELKLLAINYA